METAICSKFGKTNSGTTTVYFCEHCGSSLEKAPTSRRGVLSIVRNGVSIVCILIVALYALGKINQILNPNRYGGFAEVFDFSNPSSIGIAFVFACIILLIVGLPKRR